MYKHIRNKTVPNYRSTIGWEPWDLTILAPFSKQNRNKCTGPNCQEPEAAHLITPLRKTIDIQISFPNQRSLGIGDSHKTVIPPLKSAQIW